MTFETIVDECRKLKLEATEELIDILKAAAREKRRRFDRPGQPARFLS